MGKRELVVLFSLSSWRLVFVVWLFLATTWVCLQFVIVVFPDHTHYFGGISVYCMVLWCFRGLYDLRVSMDLIMVFQLTEQSG